MLKIGFGLSNFYYEAIYLYRDSTEINIVELKLRFVLCINLIYLYRDSSVIKSVKLKIRFILCISLIYLYRDITEIKSIKPNITCMYLSNLFIYRDKQC